MARPLHDPAAFLRERLSTTSRVLLINPPVQERRYHWLRWNQPTDLLKLSAWLRATHPGIDIRLFDFMLPDAAGNVPKHKVKETWTGAPTDTQLWHFGQPFEAFEKAFSAMSVREAWSPDLIIVSSLTSYWHVSIEKLLIKICSRLGRARRREVTICLYGNYPRFEPEHAAMQPDADVAFVTSVDTRGRVPDFDLYLRAERRLPCFFALDIDDPSVGDHLSYCLELQAHRQRSQGITRPATITVTFFNEDVCGPTSQIERVVEYGQSNPGRVVIDGIVGIHPRSLTRDRLVQLKAAGFRSLFVEHARLAGGSLDVQAYEPFLDVLRAEEHAKRTGKSGRAWLERGNITGFVGIGFPDDDLEAVVRSALRLNSFFQSIILKPHGYSPTLELTTVGERRKRWAAPYLSSPQWFPYVGHGSALSYEDYENLMRFQNVLNKRVKGTTFDFLDNGAIAKLVRETLVAESWKRHAEAT